MCYLCLSFLYRIPMANIVNHSIEPKGVHGTYIENGLDATEHVDLNANLEAR